MWVSRTSMRASFFLFKGLFLAGTLGLVYYEYQDILSCLGTMSKNLQIQSETGCELTVGVSKKVLSQILSDTTHHIIKERSCEGNIFQRRGYYL